MIKKHKKIFRNVRIFSLVALAALLTGGYLAKLPKKNLVNAQSLGYTLTVSKSSVDAGDRFTLKIAIDNNTDQPFYNISVYIYQGHEITGARVAEVAPAYNADYQEADLSDVYNPDYWTRAQLAANASATYKVVYEVGENAQEGPLTTLGYSPITSGSPVSDAKDNPTSEMLVDIHYYVDMSGRDSSKRTIRGYVDLPSVVQPTADTGQKVLPSVFTEIGTESTDLSSITVGEAEEYKGFTLDTVEGNKVIWKGAIDVSSDAFLDRVEDIDTYVFISSPGLISVDTTMAPFLDTEAELVFKNVKFLSVPKLLKDDAKVEKEVQDSGICDITSKTCTFSVEGFSSYKIEPTVNIDFPETADTQNYSFEGYIDDLDATLQYKHNNGEWRGINEVDISTGKFQFSVLLSEGENTISVKAESKNQEVDEESGTITLSEDASQGDEQPSNEPMEEEATSSVALRMLGLALIVISVITAGVMWYIIYKKKKEENEKKKPAPTGNVSTAVINREKIGSRNDKISEKAWVTEQEAKRKGRARKPVEKESQRSN